MTKQEHINFWIKESDENWDAAILLKNGGKYSLALFSFHLSLEKLLKAIWIKDNIENYPPRTHNLSYLLSQTKLQLTDTHKSLLLIIDAWNIEGRYPDYKNKFALSVNEKYIEEKLDSLNDIRKCLLNNLQ